MTAAPFQPPDPQPLPERLWPTLKAAVNQVFRPHGGDLTRETPLLFASTNRANLWVLLEPKGDAELLRDCIAPQGADRGPNSAPLGQGAEILSSHAAPILAHVGLLTQDVAIGGRKLRVACIGAVFTATHRRGQGLASRLLGHVLSAARSTADLVLASGDGGLYRREGLLPIAPLARFSWPARPDGDLDLRPGLAGLAGLAGLDMEIRDAAAADLESLAALYDAEEMHFVRTRADWITLWQAGRLLDAPATISVVTRGGRVVAYLATQHPKNGQGSPRRILELAGDRDAIVAAAPRLADELLVPPHDGPTIERCRRHGLAHTSWQFPISAQVLGPVSAATPIPWYGLNYL